MSNLWQDARLALRLIRRSPTISIAIAVILALGLGANTAVFSVVNALLLRPLPYESPDDLYLGLTSFPEQGGIAAVSYENFRDWQSRNTTFEGLAAASTPRAMTLTGLEDPLALSAEYVSANYLSVLGLEVIEGRSFTPEEERYGTSGRPALISEHLWRSLLASDSDVLGSQVQLNDRSFEIVGVVPAPFRGLSWDPVDVWLPIAAARTLLGERFVGREHYWLMSVGRLKRGGEPEAASADMDRVAAALEDEHPKVNAGARVSLQPLNEFYYGPELAKVLRFLLLFAAVVLVMCCANVAGLFFVQVMSRSREIALRVVMGASRRGLARLFAVHAVLLALVSAGLALVSAHWLTGVFVRMSDLSPATFVDQWIDTRIFALTLGGALLLGLSFGVLPAVLLPTLSLPQRLRDGGRVVGGSLANWARSGMITLEVALALVLLIAAGLMTRSLLRLTNVDPGFEIERLASVRIDLPRSRYDGAKAAQFAERLHTAAAAAPGLESTTISAPALAPFAAVVAEVSPEGVLNEGEGGVRIQAGRHSVAPGYFAALGVPLVKGRSFTPKDDVDHPLVAVLSTGLAERLWPGRDPLGQRFRMKGDERWFTAVGLVGELSHRGNGSNIRDDFYVPLAQMPEHTLFLLMRTSMTGESLAATARQQIRTLDSDLPLNRIESLRGRFVLQFTYERLTTALTILFSAIALSLTVVGLYALLAFTVGQKRQELSIRLALGASERSVLATVLRQVVPLLALGVAIGLGLSFVVQRYFASLLFGIGATDPLTIGSVVVLFVVLALIASYLPARRALKLEPARVLREE